MCVRTTGDLFFMFRRWEEACSVNRSMPSIQGLEDPLASSKRSEVLQEWHRSCRQVSMERFAKRYWKRQQSPKGRSPARRRSRHAGGSRSPAARSPAGASRGASPGGSPRRRTSDAALAAAQVAALFSTTSTMEHEDGPGDDTGGGFSIPTPTPQLERLLRELDPKTKCLSATEVVFATQVGSAMYNLATKASDEDYLIVFVKRSVVMPMVTVS